MSTNVETKQNTGVSQVLKNRFVQGILASALFLQVGIWVRNFAVLLYVMEMTKGDAFAISMISVAEFAPIFIFSFIGGTFADRWKPKKTMIWCETLSSISVFGVLITLMFGTWKIVFFVTLISAILSQFSQPSGMKLFKQHLSAEQIQLAMSIYQTIFAIFMVLGPILGTFIFHSFGIYISIIITGIAFLLAAAVLLFLPKDLENDNDKKEITLLQEMLDGIKYVKKKKALTLLGLCFMAAGLGIGLIQPLGIFIVTEQLGLSKESLQWLLTVNGAGMIVGGALAMVFAKNVAPQKMLIIGMLGQAIGIGIIGYSTNLWVTLTAQLFSGLALPCIQIGINTLIIQNSDTDFIGRVNGILSPLFTGSMVVTMSIAGSLKEMFSLSMMYEGTALLFIIGLLFILPIYNLKPVIAVESEINGKGSAVQHES
ncbi:MFS transporter [Bacillus thuringiensis serovar roskildiensis]|uniref:MFS transporter n=1 Tax=Bacillus thuringiensis serovar sooncheon TaxID=180891 RepID=A0A9Q5X6L5_BACTU|nr:MFS transporter [Bacillus thuringiensis]OTW71542.1 MFS transporter [Bacillus thuringiensis serovar coreanensis]OTX55164.1 MFS transporter [Bacillus thuringiensis serovar sooncheon]OTX58499.1 MFS transporter [Bacillus thuringiensis serovar guiyangiensis]OTX72869.1 MFS transporter [Bacillus thuringiensis serovar roskildiensis]